ncbi:aspartic peptidase domain-containing protein [Aspergillus arachidicola]|uniref:Aspartic peptidase domain-containing protein n=1 Tax=Aspergillus arachidicola TaxID=656916 RepID=A0A5N6XUK4_9EURO|nr:aspartic peptidase domain-containing protein [Aspergillus arachidicola]
MTALSLLRLCLLALGLFSLVAAQPKVVTFPLSRSERHVLEKRKYAGALLGNDILDGKGLYWVNASVGTPPQPVQLQVDTGSSDVWMFGPQSCDLNTSPCLGNAYDPTLSSTSKILDKGGFSIQYVTPGSGVKGDYVGDNFGFGSVTVQGLTMGVARQAQNVITGIMGIGFAAGESIVSQGQKPYKNIIDMLVEQELINTRAYSLWLNDVDYGFGGPNGPVIRVPFTELAVPWLDDNGDYQKLSNGNDACVFGVVPITDDSPILFGDTFLRSAYVVYDLDQQQIAIAPTRFNSEDTNIVEIGGKTGSSSPNWKTAGSNAAKVTQTATGLQAPGGGLSPATMTAPTGWVFTQTATPFHLPGKGGSLAGDQASSSPSKGAASSSLGTAVPGALASIAVASLCMAMGSMLIVLQ